MPITSNYHWTIPVPNGDFGAWGGILNTAFTAVDADLRALADLVAASTANLAKTNIANTFALTQIFNGIAATTISSASLASTGGITAQLDATARRLLTSEPTAANDAATFPLNFSAGIDATLGPFLFQVAMTPSATAANRLALIQVGDALLLRKLAIKSSQLYLGQNPPTFAGSEQVHIEGLTYVAGSLTVTGTIAGSGASLTNIPEGAVINLNADLNTITTAAGAAQTTANTAVTNAAAAQTTANTAITNAATAQTTANTAITNAATAQTQANTARSENILFARITFPAGLGWTGSAGGTRSLDVTTNIGAAYDSNTRFALQRLNDSVNQLIFDLKNTRGYI